MSQGQPPTEVTPKPPRALLVEWANDQDNWVRAIATEVLDTRRGIADERLEHFYGMLLVEKELGEGAKPTVAQLHWTTAADELVEPLRLTSLADVRGVNALCSAQAIVFNPRITVIFGENGVGKSGYVRILKRVAAVRSAEAILSNVRGIGSTTGSPHATLKYSVGTQETALDWDGTAGVHPLTRLDVFDSRAADIHLDDDLTYVYTPSDLALFRCTHEAIEKIKGKLDTAKQDATPRTNPFLQFFVRDTVVYPKVEALNPSTDVSELRALAAVSTEEEAGIDGLRERVAALRSQTPEAKTQLLRNDKEILVAARGLVELIAKFDGTAYEEQLGRWRDVSDRYAKASEKAFDGEAIPGLLREPWKAFIRAGEAYLKETDQKRYPEADAACLYCRQPLTDAAVELLRKYREFCDGELQSAVQRSAAGLADVSRALGGYDLSPLDAAIRKKLEAANPSVAARALAEVLTKLQPLRDRIVEKQSLDGVIEDLRAVAKTADEAVRAALHSIEVLLADLRAQADERAKALAEENARLRNLEARLTLRQHLDLIVSHVTKLKWGAKAQTILSSRFPLLLRSLTEASKAASETLLNHDFERRFRDECEALHAPSVRLDFAGRKGQPARRKVLSPSHRLSDVLSEGEQKAIALADFLAETSLKGAASPIVLDDPVTSLDYKRHIYLVDRLVAISRSRQVIVFTHNIWFTMELLARFEDNREQCAYFSVDVTGEAVGVVTKGTHPRADTFKTMRGRLNAVIQEAKSATGEARQALVERGYEQLRGICEVIVESELLGEVVQRYQPNIRMTCLDKIKPQALPAAIAEVTRVFEKACRYIASHSQPLEILNVRPALEELVDDWEKLQKAREAYAKAAG
jgi:energy-coupling factor transporter ATP-binding protein EcfA2